jgi:thiamine-monophosphate kinase
MSGPVPQRTLTGLGEDALLARIFPHLPGGPGVLLGPGDDTALVAAPGGSVLATTDAMVRQRDWRDDWSTGADVGAKAVAQNCADIAAMGGVPTGLLVTLVAEPATSVAWVEDFARGLGEAARAAGVPVVGGDLSSAPEGTLVVSVTALGDLAGRSPVLRSGARVGDVVALAGSLGRSAAGWLLLQRSEPGRSPGLVDYHRRPTPDLAAGPAAAAAGATAMLDVSDGLVRDAGRIARASGVAIDLDAALMEQDVAALAAAVGEEDARRCVLTGGEEHALLACFPAGTTLPVRWRPLGTVVPGAGVLVDGAPQGQGGGWDHFGG